MQLPITIGMHRSRFLDGFVVLGSLLASVSVLVFPQATLVQMTVLATICLLAGFSLRRLKPRVAALRLESGGGISLLGVTDQDFVPAEILPGATVHPWLTVVRLKMENKAPETLIVTVDSLKAADFRRLRVFLRWRADFTEANGDA